MIDVVVEEELTTRRQNTSMQVTLHKHPYTMELIRTSEYFKPGLKYTAFVSRISYYNIQQINLNIQIAAYCVSYYMFFAVKINISRRIASTGHQERRLDSVRIHI